MHSCIRCIDSPSKNRWHNIKIQILQLFIAILLVIVTPFVLPAVFGDGVAEIKKITQTNHQQPVAQNYFGVVKNITQKTGKFDEFRQIETINQEIEIEITNGPDEGTIFTSQRSVDVSNPQQLFNKNDEVIVEKPNNNLDAQSYYLVDKNRLFSLWQVMAIVAIGVILLAGIRGITSILSLVFSVLVVWYYLVPQILLANNPVLTTFITVFLITIVTMFLAHGFSKQVAIAVAGTILTLLLSTLLAIFAVQLSQLTGTVDEVAFDLQGTQIGAKLNLQGLLLAGIIIGVVGIMDDVTTAQVATIAEISKANPSLGSLELFKRGLIVGQEHAISLINTLAFAYLGTGLPLILLVTAFRSSEWWVLLNSEFIAEELIRTLVGSLSLLLAIPITTIMAAFWLKKFQDKDKEKLENQDKEFDEKITPFNKMKKMSFSEVAKNWQK